MITYRQAYDFCKSTLKNNGFEAYEFEALTLFEFATGCSRTGLITNGNKALNEQTEMLLNKLIQKRLSHYPLQYIIESWSFMGFDLCVGEGVLIPRDDTEVVTSLCIDFLKNRESKICVDLCAGSGAISIALSKLATAEVSAVELSDTAYNFLQKNIKLNKTAVKALKDDILKCYNDFENSSLDLIVSNPPYIKSDELSSLQTEVQFEPKMALDGGATGYDFYESIIKNWSVKLKVGGALAFELGEGQADYVMLLMKNNGFENIQTANDLGNIQRAIIGTMVRK